MIDYKSTSGSDSLVERVPSANLDGPISLTWLWEIIVRTKRLPDDLDPKVLFIVLRDRLRNVEREVRQHALRVLADLVPVIDRTSLDKHMEFLLPDLIVNLSHVAPAVRKGTVDVLRIYLKNTPHPNEVLKKLMTVVPEDSHLMQGLLMAVPYFANYQISDDTLVFLLRQLFSAANQEFLRETSICSLVKTRSKIGTQRFNLLIGDKRLNEFHELCQEHNIHLPEKNEDNVILETEITLETGPAITMKIHEEQEHPSLASNNSADDGQDDSESELVTRSPRKVHFGGEVVKMRTPESDSNSNHHSSDDNDVHTSMVIDRPTSIKITLGDNVASIKTRHKSMIPVRITTGGSNPSTPRKKMKPKRLYKSAPDLGKLQVSKIPLPHADNSKSTHKSREPEKKNKESENKESRVRKHSRGEDKLSPVPVHDEIEVFHNLTRSPERQLVSSVENTKTEPSKREVIKPKPEAVKREVTKQEAPKKEAARKEFPEAEASKSTYPSFQLYNEEKEVKRATEEKANSLSPLETIVRDLTHKEDIWTRTRALDDLITMLRKNSISLDSISLPQLLQTLFLYQKQLRLQYRAQEALTLLISSISLQTFNELYSQLCSDVIKVAPPPGVRLSLLVMKRSSPKKFFDTLKVESNDREATLQALIAAARTYPSSDIDLTKGIQLAFDAMKDNKRAVRQAALEALASLAQVAGNTMILQAINDMSKDVDDSDHLVTVVRTRLSRRQLPTVDLDGSIRYSSPREQEEFDWLCGGTPSLQKTSSLNSIKVPSNNYWRHNLRHEMDLPVIESPSFNDLGDDSNGGNREQIWAIDASSFPKIENGSIEKATLCPVYVLHRDASQVNGRTYRNYDRGRSNSPPTRRHNKDSHEVFTDINGNKAKRLFKQTEQFRKSFSSEQIYNGNVKSYEPTSFSLSSRSSTTSTGSSARSGIWLREFRSGIPIPINLDTKLKFRSSKQSEAYTGPLIAQEPLSRKAQVAPIEPPKIPSSTARILSEKEEGTQTKLESPQTTPVIRRSSAQQFTQPLPPQSSGSESSGYFTPPAEHHLKDPGIERFIPDESFEENNNFEIIPEANFQVVDSEASETHELEEPTQQRQSSASSAASNSRIEDVAYEDPEPEPKELQELEEFEEPKRYSPLDEVDFSERRTFTEPRSKSRSEGNLKSSLPEITERKIVNSAPPLNVEVNLNIINSVPYSFAEISPVKTSLPSGSVASSEDTPTKKHSGQSPRRLPRRLSVRTPSVKRVSKSPKRIEVRPVSRPKEILSQGLAQMESCDWETIIKGLNTLIRLSKSSPEVLELQMHAICVALGKSIKNLRSQVARIACHAAGELFVTCKRGLEVELEELAAPLLQRTADTNKFLRGDANAALDAMSLNLSVPRVVAIVASKGSTHQNCVVRAVATRLLSDIAMRIGPEKVFQLPKETRDKFLLVGANGLTEGSLETRQHAKALMSTLVGHHQFQRALSEAVPQHTVRHITKTINSLK